MPGPFLTRDFELAAQIEATFATSPGALAGADFFKSKTKFPFKRNVARYDRDNARDNDQASVITTQKGRESASWAIEGDIIPAGAATPTKPDMDLFFEAHLGTQRLATAHTTTTTGSTTTVVQLTAGGVAAAGLAAGDMVAVDVDATFGLEVRQIVSIATDAITVDRALSAAPATGRNVKTGWTVRLSEAQQKSLHLWGYLNGDNFRHRVGGAIARMMALDIDFSGEAPVGGVKFSGDGEKIATHTTSRPTPVTVGQPLLPSVGKCWIGTALTNIVKASLNSDNGLELRANESGSLFPTGVKRTGNKGRYNISQTLEVLLTTGAIEGYYDNAASLTAYDVLTQLGATAGQIVAWRTPKFIPSVDISEVGDEASVNASGRCYGTSGDDELSIFFG